MIDTVVYPFPVQHQKLINDAIDLAFIDEGKGETTLLFVHGLGHSLLGWTKNIDYLRNYFRCIAVDLPGNGLSATGKYPYSMHFFSEILQAFIEAKQLKNVVMVGHSMGGQIAMTYALKYQDHIKSLILCAPAGLEVFNEWEKNLYRNTMYFVDLVSNEENSLRKAIQNSFYIMPDNVPSFTQQLVDMMKLQEKGHYRYMMDGCINAMLDEPVFDRLNEIKLPVLILFGERDNLIPNKFIHPTSTKNIAMTAAREFEHAEVEMIAQCGHFLQWEKAATVNGFIRSFGER